MTENPKIGVSAPLLNPSGFVAQKSRPETNLPATPARGDENKCCTKPLARQEQLRPKRQSSKVAQPSHSANVVQDCFPTYKGGRRQEWDLRDQCSVGFPQQFLYFLLDPHEHGSLRPSFGPIRR